ncbi:odorant receptor 56a-like isoform X2 [Lycorma delicatula]|uniref:odorant receptor 56a-like isoform X2 n=1 Tax=Lycorma delicatula TaxID=130591 RepID=UPI003F519B4F
MCLIKNDKINLSKDLQNVPLPIELWIPERFSDSLLVFIIVYVLSSLDLITLAFYSCIAIGAISATVQSIIIDLKLYCVKLREIDTYKVTNYFYNCKYDGNEHDSVDRTEKFHNDSNVFNGKIDSKKLKLYTSYLIKEHDLICRNILDVNKFVQLTITATNQSLCFQMCIYFYLCLAEHNAFIKTAFFCIALFEILLLYVYCFNGQKLIDEYDEVRRALGDCTWVNKPQWFKKMLLIMMTRSMVPVHIKPFGLYVLNLNNFIGVVKVTYSYFNLLRSLK